MEPTDTTMESAQPDELGDEEWDEDEYDDVDAEAEAEAIARRLGEELLAGIAKVQADQASKLASTQALTEGSTSGTTSVDATPGVPSLSARIAAALQTINNILHILDGDSVAKNTFSATIISEAGGATVFDLLKQISDTGAISRDIAGIMSQVMMTLASSESLFGGQPIATAPAQADSGKRKRNDEGDDTGFRVLKRPFYTPPSSATDLQAQMLEAIAAVSQALTSRAPHQPIDSAFVTSIQLQLHQIFLFSVTSAPLGGPYVHALQEIGGLIQVLGVLSGIQIGPTAGSDDPSWLASPSVQADIITAVYPCLIPGCQKTFSRLFTLRAHQRIHATHRPFRCPHCPASFVRNHDLKRHKKLHDKKGWKCTGCGKLFSRRDAIKRHKNNSRGKDGSGSPCVTAAIEEVEMEEHEGDDSVREERRAKIWSGIAEQANASARAAMGYPPEGDGSIEEGEIPHLVIVHVQSAMMGLHGLLQAHVTAALGSQTGPSATDVPSADPTGQATLASVIARAQSNLPVSIPAGNGAAGDSTSPPGAPISSSNVGPAPSVMATDTAPLLSTIGLSAEQAQMLEQAIANAALAAQAQAEAEAALEEEEDGYDDHEGDYDDVEQAPEAPMQIS